MRKDEARIGQKVKYMGCSVIGECTGVIVEIFNPCKNDFPLYQEGFAAVKVDELPDEWPYPGSNFAPPIDELNVLIEEESNMTEMVIK